MSDSYNLSNILEKTPDFIANLQVSGIEIGFDVLTAIVLFFTMFGYFISSSKDRVQKRDIEIGKSIDILIGHIDILNDIKSKINKRTKHNPLELALLESQASKIKNYIAYKFSLSLTKWLRQRDVIKALQGINSLEAALSNIMGDAQSCTDNSNDVNTLVKNIDNINGYILNLVNLFLDKDKFSYLKSLNKNSSIFYKILTDAHYETVAFFTKFHAGIRIRYILFLIFITTPLMLFSFSSWQIDIYNLTDNIGADGYQTYFNLVLAILLIYTSIGIYKADQAFNFKEAGGGIIGKAVRFMAIWMCIVYFVMGAGTFKMLLDDLNIPIISGLWSAIALLAMVYYIFKWFKKNP
jgi:hypothetical protein